MNEVFTRRAKEYGFIAVGFSKPTTPPHFDYFRRWLKEVEIGNMHYLKKNIDIRRDPSKLLEGSSTIITLAYPYPACKPSTPDGYTASRYSTPQEEDYHLRLKRLGKQLCAFIREMFPESKSRVCVDSAPILERSFAEMSGVGFIGKNNMLIIPGYGSYCFLVEIVTTAPFAIPSMGTQKKDICGSCTKCIDMCPTGALKAPFCIDVSKCLSYLTIEAHDAIDKEIAGKMGNTFFGCDVCQEVCPFNNKESGVIILPSAKEILAMTERDFKTVFGKTAFERAGEEKLKKNIQALITQ
jgi:epoxyqueuosine reductase